MKQAFNKRTGEQVIGILETIPGTALINGFDDNNEPIYVGETDVNWDGQESQTDGEGGLLFIDESGNELTIAEVEFREVEEEE